MYSANALLKDLCGLPRKRWKQYRKSLSYQNVSSSQIKAELLDALISKKITTSTPFFVMRPGGTEQQILGLYLSKRILGPRGPGFLESVRAKWLAVIHATGEENDYGPQLFVGESQSGISPTTVSNLDEFSLEYLRQVGNADLLINYDWSVWISALNFVQGKPHAPYEAFDPLERSFRGGRTWLEALDGKRVLVVSPFAKSIESQYLRRRHISVVEKILPEFELITLKPPVTFAGAQTKTSWYQELDLVRRQMDKLNFDVALTSAGAYGGPLAGYAKQLGKVGIHYGGALQLLFGISGKRWREEAYHFLHSVEEVKNWISPAQDERPPQPETLEGGAYW